MSRKQLDEIEQNVNNVSNKCERARLKYERVSKVLVNAKAGIEKLTHLLRFKVVSSEEEKYSYKLFIVKLYYVIYLPFLTLNFLKNFLVGRKAQY